MTSKQLQLKRKWIKLVESLKATSTLQVFGQLSVLLKFLSMKMCCHMLAYYLISFTQATCTTQIKRTFFKVLMGLKEKRKELKGKDMQVKVKRLKEHWMGMNIQIIKQLKLENLTS